MSGWREKIEEVTGISVKVQDEIFEQVKVNHAKLNSCVAHDFSICIVRRTKETVTNPTPEQRFGAKWRCSRCGGEVDCHAKHWYELGMKHADAH
jgi:hypothetical protein